jgi:hypothetical protein
MLSRSNTRERPRIEPNVVAADTDVANKCTLSVADSLRLNWPEHLMEAGVGFLNAPADCGAA